MTLFIDGDFKTDFGDCKFHCSPTCHPGQIDPDHWHYGCTHKAWYQNKYGDFVPFVECGGFKDKCELKDKRFKKMVGRYKQGKSCSLNYAKDKVAKLELELKMINELTTK